jgi:hypothetical protein
VTGADATVTQGITTDGTGTGLVLISAGTQAGLATIHARTEALHTVANGLQVPPSYGAVALPRSGSAADVAVQTRWANNVALVHVDHGAVAGEPGWGAVSVAPTPVPEPSSTEEPPVDPPVDPAAAAQTPSMVDHPTSERPPPQSKIDEPWLRAHLGYVASSYEYSQVPAGTGGPLIDDSFLVGGEAGSPAAPQGFQLGARAWLPSLPYFGLEASYRATYYGVTTEAFGDQVAKDTLHNLKIDALARYFIDAGQGRYWLGLRLGVHTNDLIYFTQERSSTAIVYKYDTLVVPSLAVGADLGLDVGRFYLGMGLYSEAAYGSGGGYAGGLNLDLGYDITDYLSIDGGFGALTREINLVGEDSGDTHGTLTDGQGIFRIGLGAFF